MRNLQVHPSQTKETGPIEEYIPIENSPSELSPLPYNEQDQVKKPYRTANNDWKSFLFAKYFTAGLERKSFSFRSKTLLSVLNSFVLGATAISLFISFIASILIIHNQSGFSDSVVVAHYNLSIFRSSSEIITSRDECTMVSSKDIRIFAIMHENFPLAIAVTTVLVAIVILAMFFISRRLKHFQLQKIFMGVTAAFFSLKIALIVSLFYYPMYYFTQLLGAFLTLQSNQCFVRDFGNKVTGSLTYLEDQFHGIKTWMLIELGSVCSVVWFLFLAYLLYIVFCEQRQSKAVKK